jgi:uncharacterized membrane protein YoaK (UPF0700 family)
MKARTGDLVAGVALAATSGAVDMLALADLGGAFASVVTGNLVTTGFGLGTADLNRIVPSVTAVAAFAVGVVAVTLVWRRSLLGPLLAELVLLLGVLTGWLVTSTHPAGPVALVLLALAALAMGGQSVAALRLGAATTYLTGALTNALHDLVSGKAGGRRAAARQLLALVLGALAAAGLRGVLRWAVPLLPMVLLTVAIVAARVRKS